MPSHYLNQCLIIVNWTLKNKLQWNFNQNIKLFTHEHASDNIVCEMSAILSSGRWVKTRKVKSPLSYSYGFLSLTKWCNKNGYLIQSLCTTLHDFNVLSLFVSSGSIFLHHNYNWNRIHCYFMSRGHWHHQLAPARYGALKDMSEIDYYLPLTKHNKAWNVPIPYWCW